MERKRSGYRMIHALLRREGFAVNRKRVHRIWKEERLQVPRKRRKRRRGPKGDVVRRALYRNHVWSWDFVEDSTERGERLRFLTMVDEYTRESLALEVGRSLGAEEALAVMDWLLPARGAPCYLRSDNGPEFVASEVRRWLAEKRVKTIYIEPGSPWENAYIESFNGTFRDECLNMNVFGSAEEAGRIVESRRKDYNGSRPHSSLGYMTPLEFSGKGKGDSQPPARCAGSSSQPTASFHFQHKKDSTLSFKLVQK